MCTNALGLLLQGENTGEHILILCNTIGSPVDSKSIDIEPKYLAMTETHVVAASDDVVYVWQFNAAVRRRSSEMGYLPVAVDNMGINKLQSSIRTFHIDEPTRVQVTCLSIGGVCWIPCMVSETTVGHS